MPSDVKCFPTEAHNLCCTKFFPFQSLTFSDILWVLLLLSTHLFKQYTFIGIYLTLNTIKKPHQLPLQTILTQMKRYNKIMKSLETYRKPDRREQPTSLGWPKEVNWLFCNYDLKYSLCLLIHVQSGRGDMRTEIITPAWPKQWDPLSKQAKLL